MPPKKGGVTNRWVSPDEDDYFANARDGLTGLVLSSQTAKVFRDKLGLKSKDGKTSYVFNNDV